MQKFSPLQQFKVSKEANKKKINFSLYPGFFTLELSGKKRFCIFFFPKKQREKKKTPRPVYRCLFEFVLDELSNILSREIKVDRVLKKRQAKRVCIREKVEKQRERISIRFQEIVYIRVENTRIRNVSWKKGGEGKLCTNEFMGLM